MGCNANILGIIDSCGTSVGGIKAAVFMNVNGTMTFEAPAADGSGWKLSASYDLMPMTPSKQTSSFTSTLNVDVTNGSSYVSTEVILQFNKMTNLSRVELNKIIAGRWRLFIKDANDKWYYFGNDKGDYAYASAGTGQTGGEKSDGNYYQVTITANASCFPVPCDDANTVGYLESVTGTSPRTPIKIPYVGPEVTAISTDSDGISVIDTSGNFSYLVGDDVNTANNYNKLVVRASAVSDETADWLKPGVISYKYAVVNGDTPSKVTSKNADIAFAADYTDNSYVAPMVYGRDSAGDWVLLAYANSGGGTTYFAYGDNEWSSVSRWTGAQMNKRATLYVPLGYSGGNITLNAYLG